VVGLLDAFHETWSQARETFGQGTPEDGAKFDGSSRLLQMKSSVEAAAPDSRWQGSASDAYAAANKGHAQVYGKLADLDKRMAAEVTNAANVVTTGRQNLDNVKSWVTSMAASIPDTDADERDRKLLPIVNRGVGQLSDIIQKSTGEMTDIRGRVHGIKGEYDALTNQKFAPGEKKPGEKDDKKSADMLGATEDGQPDEKDVHKKAEQDVHKTLAGDQQAAARVDNVLSGIKPGQKLTEEQSAYLSQMQAQQKGMSVEALKKAEERLGDHKGVIANSWQLMSNKDVQFSVTEPKVGALDDPKYTTRGGSDLLPDSVRDVLQRADQTIVTDEHPMTKALAFGSQLDSIADIVKDGNPAFQTGTELDRQMILAADRAMDVVAENPRTGGAEAIQSLFEAVDDDHRIINDQVMGRNGVSANDFLHDVNAIDWPDNGKAAGHLFSWTGDSNLAPDSQIAAETADKYAEYIGDKRPELMNIDGQTLGQRNPELVQGYAHGLAPYVDAMAGGTGSGGPFEIDDETSRHKGLMPHAKGVFAVLNTDSVAAGVINQAAYTEAMKHETAFALNPGDPQSQSHMTAAATMRGLVDVGAHEAFQAFEANGHKSDVTENQWKKSGFDAAVAGLATGGTLIPGVGIVAGPVVSQVGAVFGQQLFDAPPAPPQNPLPQMAEPVSSTVILDAMLAAGHPVDLPPGYIEGGHVVQPNGVDDFDFEHAINEEIGRQTVLVNGDGPDEIYTDRYNLVIQDPDIQETPKKKGP
jgi:hypothetical protein